jgi:hypothetical protein
MRRMARTGKSLAAGALVLAFLVAGCNGKTSSGVETVTNTVTVSEPDSTEPTSAEPPGTVTVTVPKVTAVKIGPGAPKRQIQFGHIRSLKRNEGEYILRFDPAQHLTGATASDAAEEDTGSSDVPNDYYVVDESDRLFAYKVPADAHVTVLANGVEGTRITVAQLAQLVKGKDPLGHPLFEPLETGVWILIEADTVRAIDQQYVP